MRAEQGMPLLDILVGNKRGCSKNKCGMFLSVMHSNVSEPEWGAHAVDAVLGTLADAVETSVRRTDENNVPALPMGTWVSDLIVSNASNLSVHKLNSASGPAARPSWVAGSSRELHCVMKDPGCVT